VELDGTELSQAIKAVRAGLAVARQDGDGSPIRFTVKDIVLDLGIEIRHTASGCGGVKTFVVSADARAERARAATHRMALTLQVEEDTAGNELLIGDADRGLDPLPDHSA
jgi:hypothetical protein